MDNFEGTLKLRLPVPAKPEDPKIKQMEAQINNLQQLKNLVSKEFSKINLE